MQIKPRITGRAAGAVTQKIISELAQFGVPRRDVYNPENMVKIASLQSTEPPLTKIAMSEAEKLLQDMVSHGLGVYESQAGHVWRTEVIDGVEYLVRDDELCAQTQIVQDLMTG